MSFIIEITQTEDTESGYIARALRATDSQGTADELVATDLVVDVLRPDDDADGDTDNRSVVVYLPNHELVSP